MTKQEIYEIHHQEIYYFLLKKMKDSDDAKNILQNTFLKAFENYGQVRDEKKIKSWLFRIARNEMLDYYKREPDYVSRDGKKLRLSDFKETEFYMSKQFCCFDTFVDELPEIYKRPIKLIYKEGKKQSETAEILGLKLTTVKARVRRAKSILVKNFNECCHYKIAKNGKLVGEQNCVRCNKIL